jgi:hypothetical protein
MYPACNARAPYCHLCPAPLYNIFPHYLINGAIFGKKIYEHKMCVLIFCTTFVRKNSHSTTRVRAIYKQHLRDVCPSVRARNNFLKP